MLKEDENGFMYEELATEGFDAQYRFYVIVKAKGEGCYVIHNHATGAVAGTKEAAEKFYFSAEYQAAKAIRDRGVDTDLMIVEGL